MTRNNLVDQKTGLLLIEIGVEELPFSSNSTRLDLHFKRLLFDELCEKRMLDSTGLEDIRTFLTPRRIGVLIPKVLAKQPEKIELKTGPSMSVALHGGEYTKAAHGFARSNGVSLNDLFEHITSSGKKVLAANVKNEGGGSIDVVLQQCLEVVINNLPIAKKMRWGNGAVDFVRPVRWFTAMFDNRLLALSIFDHIATCKTYGHRFHNPDGLLLSHSKDYEKTLIEKGFIIPNYDDRKAKIKTDISNMEQEKGIVVVDNESLLSMVTELVECPNVLFGNFDARFLSMPREVLNAVLNGHQKYFSVQGVDGELLPHFIVFSNLNSTDSDLIISGNSRVLEARLSDAEFFFKRDLSTSFVKFGVRLSQVLFHRKLGSIDDKVHRITSLACQIGEGSKLDVELIRKSGLLCKNDLATDIVDEFPELQGMAGGHYARHQGEKEEVCVAIAEHYLPRFADDDLPQSSIGQIISVADRIDTIIGLFGVGERPTGLKDRYALRRAALGLLRIMLSPKFSLWSDFNLVPFINKSIKSYQQNNDIILLDDTRSSVIHFIRDRLQVEFRRSYPADVVAAVLFFDVENFIPADFKLRIQALNDYFVLKNKPNISSVEPLKIIQTYKRISNILDKHALPQEGLKLSSRTMSDCEISLQEMIKQVEEKQTDLLTSKTITKDVYFDAISFSGKLIPVIENFFDNLMVIDPDPEIKNSRLMVLQKCKTLLSCVGDLSIIQIQSKH